MTGNLIPVDNIAGTIEDENIPLGCSCNYSPSQVEVETGEDGMRNVGFPHHRPGRFHQVHAGVVAPNQDLVVVEDRGGEDRSSGTDLPQDLTRRRY